MSDFTKYIIIILSFSFFACKSSISENVDNEEMVIAAIGNKVLTKSDVEGFGINSNNIEDSIQVVQAFVENWLRNNAVLIEAEANYTDNKTLDKLVKDYRNSLLLYDYESKIVSESLDTIVTKEQIKEHYDNYGDQYLLSNKIYKYWLAIVPAKARKIEVFYNDWKKGNEEAVKKYCKEKSELCQFSDNEWSTDAELYSFIPSELFKSKQFTRNSTLLKNYKGKEYFVKIFDVVAEGSVPPIEYIEAKIEKVILNNRKQEIIKRVKEQLYKKQLNAKNVKIYVNN